MYIRYSSAKYLIFIRIVVMLYIPKMYLINNGVLHETKQNKTKHENQNYYFAFYSLNLVALFLLDETSLTLKNPKNLQKKRRIL